MRLAVLLGRGTDMIMRCGFKETSKENFEESNKKSYQRIHLFIYERIKIWILEVLLFP